MYGASVDSFRADMYAECQDAYEVGTSIPLPDNSLRAHILQPVTLRPTVDHDYTLLGMAEYVLEEIRPVSLEEKWSRNIRTYLYGNAILIRFHSKNWCQSLHGYGLKVT